MGLFSNVSSKTTRHTIDVVVTLIAALSFASLQPPVLAGYFPAWRFEGFDLNRLDPYTDVLYFSIQPTANGELDMRDIDIRHLEALNTVKKRLGFRLHICVGGWERSAGFMASASDPAKRARFVQELLKFCDSFALDGVDLDWEHPKTEAEAKAYGDLIGDLRRALSPKGRSVTAAIAAWQKMDASAVKALDRVHLMAYDHPDRHSTAEKSFQEVEVLKKMGFPPAKIVLGVPFYGRRIAAWNDTKPYSAILAEWRPKDEVDEAEGFYFNGRGTLRAKAAFVKREALAGMMVWEASHDALGEASLARLLAGELGIRN